MQTLLRQSSETRDALLQFLVARLSQMQHLQVKEASLLKKRDEWFLKVHRGSDSLPKPNRWHASAAVYRDAAHALGRGDTARCWQLIRKALECERVARADAPKSLNLHLMTQPSAPPQPTDALSSPVETKPALDLADQILNRTHHVDAASTRRRALHDWFTPEEEEEESDATD